jgi:predicted cytidylate kinase
MEHHSGKLIAVAGGPGTGTTTLCRLLATRLGLTPIHAGHVFRDLAKEHGLSLIAFGRYAQTHPDVDRELDRRMVALARRGNAVLEGRLSLWHANQAGLAALRVLVVAPELVRAQRVAQREGRTDVDAVLRENRTREASEARRYGMLYGFNPNDQTLDDLVLNSAEHSPDALADAVERMLASGGPPPVATS